MQQTTKPDLCPVETKIKAAFVCQHRPLLPGEKPKRAGQDTVFEATGEVHSELLALLQSSNSEQHHVHVTVKHDGMCSKIVRTQDGTHSTSCLSALHPVSAQNLVVPFASL